MLQRFENFILKNSLFNKEQSLLLALSGGADSVCLFHLLREGGFNFSVAHCNFQLRGEESNQDELFVINLAKKYNIKLFIQKFDTRERSVTDKKGIQELARELRYNWFKTLMKAHSFDFLLTAHHQTDNLETMLINLVRGTGIKGLHGIPLNENNVSRPLMFTHKEEIITFLKANNYNFREDSSNASDYYLRNQIRHSVLPVLTQIEGEIVTRFYETSQKVKAYQLMTEALMSERWKSMTQAMDGNIKIDLSSLNKMEFRHLFLFHHISIYGFSMLQIDALLNASQVGKRIYSEKYELIKERYHLILRLKENKNESISILVDDKDQVLCINGQTIDIHIFRTKIEPNYTLKDTLFINADKVSFPLILRTWQDGDRLRPLGMKGYKKVSDILTDKKVENSKRDSYIVLQQSENEVIALLPLVVSEDYKIETDTKAILSITLNMA